ncbi:MAG: hypothetical protein ACREBE_20310, partial [bacterium]
IAPQRTDRRSEEMSLRFPRSTRAASLAALVSLAVAGCTWLYGPEVALPKDTAEAVEKPAIGSRALLTANQTELELASWGPALAAAVDSLGGQVGPAQSSVVRAAIRRTYAPQRLFDRMATSLMASWDPAAAQALFDFYQSWLGQRILRAQAGRRDQHTLERFQNWNASFDSSQYSATRVELLKRIDRALLTSQTAVWLNRAYLDAGLASLAEGVGSSAGPPLRALRVRYAAEEPALYPVAADQVLHWNLYSFAWLSDGDLEHYAAFAESQPAQWWVVSCARGYRVALTGAGDDLYQALRPRNSF